MAKSCSTRTSGRTTFPSLGGIPWSNPTGSPSIWRAACVRGPVSATGPAARTQRWDLLVGYGDGKIRLYRGLAGAGDFNGNGALDADDFTILVKALDKPVPAAGSPCDLNYDGVVNNLDLRLFADRAGWPNSNGVPSDKDQ